MMDLPEDPNATMRRPLQEFINVAAAPMTGQTRDLFFLCRDRAHFEKVAEHLRTELLAAGIFKDTGEFRLVFHPNPDGCRGTGELVPALDPKDWQGPYSKAELSKRWDAAYSYIARPRCAPAP